MALPATLAILGELIRGDATPEETVRRIADAKDLSEEERAELAAIPYERLRPYLDDYYAAETDMVRWAFEYTWAVLRALNFGRPAASNASGHDFMVDFRTCHPNRTHSVREMSGHFIAYLRNNCAAWLAPHPWLFELAEAERMETEILYAMDNPLGKALSADEAAALLDRTVDELLALRVTRAEAVRATALSFDLGVLKEMLAGEASLSPDVPSVNAARASQSLVQAAGPVPGALPELPLLDTPQPMALVRDGETLEPVWYWISEIERAMIDAAPEEATCTLGDLIAPHLELNGNTAEAGAEEQAHFARLLESALHLIEIRALLVA